MGNAEPKTIHTVNQCGSKRWLNASLLLGTTTPAAAGPSSRLLSFYITKYWSKSSRCCGIACDAVGGICTCSSGWCCSSWPSRCWSSSSYCCCCCCWGSSHDWPLNGACVLLKEGLHCGGLLHGSAMHGPCMAMRRLVQASSQSVSRAQK
jgi:hypothetical protein